MGASKAWAIDLYNERIESDVEFAAREEAERREEEAEYAAQEEAKREADRAEYYAVRVDDEAAATAAEAEYYAALQERDQLDAQEQQQ
jgi:hypothetical protein